MNAAIFVITSALATGGDVTPAGAWGDAPLIVQASGCSSCGPTVASSCGCGKASFLDKIKAKFAPKPHCGCEPACGHKITLLDKVKARGGCKKSACECYSASPCATPGAPIVAPPAPTTIPPKEMPKLKEVPKSDAPKTSGGPGAISIPSAPAAPIVAPAPSTAIPAIPAAPISGGSGSSGSSPY